MQKRQNWVNKAKYRMRTPVVSKFGSRTGGLHDLNVIHDELEHGAELIFSERADMDELAIQQWVSEKQKLGVFAPIRPSNGLDYRAKDVVEEAHKLMQEHLEDV